MLKYTITFVEEKDKDSFDEEVREDKLYYRVTIPERQMTLEVRSIPGSNMFQFHVTGKGMKLPKDLEGSFTSRKYIEDSLAKYCSNPANQVSIQKAPKPTEPQVITNQKA